MKNIDLLYDIEIKKPDGTIRKKTKPKRCHSFVRQFPDFLLKVFRIGFPDYGGSSVGNTQVIKDTGGVSRSGLVNGFVATGGAGDIACGTVVGTGKTGTYITPDGGSVPAMTSDSFGGRVASASNEYRGAYLAFDNVITGMSNGWSGSKGGGSSWWLQLDTGVGVSNIVTGYSISYDDTDWGNAAPKDWTLQGSNNGSSWDILDTVTGQTGWTNPGTRSYVPDVMTTAYRYFRINITDNNGNGGYVTITELRLFRAGGTSIIPVTINDYRLVSEIIHGTGSGQLQYAPESFGSPTLDLATSSSYFVCSRLFTNNSGGNININEIGLNIRGKYYTSYSFMIIRDIVDPINLAVGESVTVNYTMRMTA